MTLIEPYFLNFKLYLNNQDYYSFNFIILRYLQTIRHLILAFLHLKY